jgi:hypothetical protein
MNLSELSPISALKTALVAAGIDGIIYEGSKPTSGLPDSFIELYVNGSMSSDTENMSIVNGAVLLSINVKLLSTGEVNSKKEALIMSTLNTLFFNGKTVVSGKYRFAIDKNNIVYGGRGLSEGYSTKVLNLLVKTF